MNKQIQTAAKRMAAIIAAGTMAVAPGVATLNVGTMTAWANQTTAGTPAATDTGTITIKNIESGATVKLYQIIGATWKGTGDFDSWSVDTKAASFVTKNTDGTYKVDVQGLSADIADTTKGWTVAKAYNDTTELTATSTGSDVSFENVKPGTYIALVTPPESKKAETYIYNPMLVSVGYTDNTLTNGEVNANNESDSALATVTYAKRKPVSLTKVITNADTKFGGTSADSAKGDDLQVGDTQDFKLTTAFPDYRGYSSTAVIKFEIADNQDAGLSKPESDPVVMVNGNSINATETDAEGNTVTYFTISYGNFSVAPAVTNGAVADYSSSWTDAPKGNDFKITFTRACLDKYPGGAVSIEYSSKLNSNATQKVDANDNDVTLTYTNDYTGTTKVKDDHTYDYTFPIDVKKVDADGTTPLGGTNVEDRAQFKITRMMLGTSESLVADNKTDHVAYDSTAKTVSENGTLTFDHLDEGYYMITEERAPKGYTKNTEAFYIKIEPLNSEGTVGYNTDGTISNWKITRVDNKGVALADSAVTTATFTAHKATGANAANDLLTVKDTKVTGLPSTGARSALILTIAGIGVMVVVLAASRRKKVED